MEVGDEVGLSDMELSDLDGTAMLSIPLAWRLVPLRLQSAVNSVQDKRDVSMQCTQILGWVPLSDLTKSLYTFVAKSQEHSQLSNRLSLVTRRCDGRPVRNFPASNLDLSDGGIWTMEATAKDFLYLPQASKACTAEIDRDAALGNHKNSRC